MSRKHNSVLYLEGRYDYMHPDNVEAQYRWYLCDDSPVRQNFSAVLPLDCASQTDNPLTAAREALLHAENCFYNSKVKDLKILVEYLEKHEANDSIGRLIKEKASLLEEIEEAKQRLKDIEIEIEEFRNEQDQ